MAQNKILQGIWLGLAAFSIWACGDAGTKFAGKADVPVTQIMSLAGLVALAVIGGASFIRGRGFALKPNRLKIEIPRALLFVLQSTINVITFTQLPLTSVYAALFTSPMIVALAGAVFMKEKISRKQAFLIMAGFIGALITINPFTANYHEGSFLAWLLLLIYPFSFSTNMILMRFQRETETSESLSFFPIFVRTMVCLPIALFSWKTMTGPQLAAVLGTGCTMGVGFILISSALSKAPAAVVSPLHYAQLVVGAILGYLFWGNVPGVHVIVGSALIIASGVAGARIAARKQAVSGAPLEIAEG